MRGGFWRRPVSRTYGYNLEVGEHYYSPMTSYLEAERGSRGETPGALTYSERLARKWINGRRYESTELRDRVQIIIKVTDQYLMSSSRQKIADSRIIFVKIMDETAYQLPVSPFDSAFVTFLQLENKNSF